MNLFMCIKLRALFALQYARALYCVLLYKRDEKPNEYNELVDSCLKVHRIQITVLYNGKPKMGEVHATLLIIKA